MRFREYPDREALMTGLASQIAGELQNALAGGAPATLAVPGGTTPGPIFDVLAGTDLPWDRIKVMLTDERWLPETSERSNTRLLRERLITGRAAAAHLVPLYRKADTPEDALNDLTAGLSAHLPISVLLLGMGADMHTASLFPGADQLEAGLAADAPPLLAMRAPGAPEPRVTLTAPVLKSAKSTHILITGSEKRAALDAATKLDPCEAPVATVLAQAEVHWAE